MPPELFFQKTAFMGVTGKSYKTAQRNASISANLPKTPLDISCFKYIANIIHCF